MGADNLQADGKTGGGKSGGNRDRRQAPRVYRAGIAEQQEFLRTEQIRVLLQFIDRRRGNRCGCSYKDVYLLKHLVDLGANLFEFAAALLNLRWADVLAFADAA